MFDGDAAREARRIGRKAPFGARSPIRRFAAEPVLLVGGQRALLLQLAHAKVAAGVDAHSDFRARPLARLWGTADKIVTIVWGSGRESHLAWSEIMSIHDRVHGRLPEAAGKWNAGDPYAAHDTDLLRWVWATLVETTELMTQRYVRHFRPGEAESLYEDWRTFATWFGVPGRDVPETRAEFEEFWLDTLHGPEIAVSETARRVARSIVYPPLPVPRDAKHASGALTSGLLPPHIRDEYGLRWGPAEQRSFLIADRTLRALYPRLPRIRRALPASYVSVRRVVYPLRRLMATA